MEVCPAVLHLGVTYHGIPFSCFFNETHEKITLKFPGKGFFFLLAAEINISSSPRGTYTAAEMV